MTLYYSLYRYRNRMWLVLMALVMMCTACSEDTIPEVEENQLTPIGFGMNETRAVIAQSSDIQAFSVWARFSNAETPEMTLMDGDVVYRDPNDTNEPKRFTYVHTKYWIDGTYHFYALHPSTTSDAYEGIELDNSNQKLTISNFNSASQTDLAVSTGRVERKYPSDGTGDVVFNLRHALTQVKLTLYKDEGNTADEIKVTGIQLSGMKKKGTYTITGPTGEWSELTENYTWYKALDQVPLNTTSGEGFVSTLLLIPQTLAENALSLSVNFQITHSGGTEAMVKFVKLPAVTWKENTIVNYNCTLGVDYNINLGTVTIETWGEVEAGGTVIIK